MKFIKRKANLNKLASFDFKVKKILKTDAFGSIEYGIYHDINGIKIRAIKRNYSKNFWLSLPSKILGNMEKKALYYLELSNSKYFPKLIVSGNQFHIRTFIPGESIHQTKKKLDDAYFKEAYQLLKIMRKNGVSNNDLAKEANWLITEDNKPAINDFQLAFCTKKHSKLFLLLCREDLRHLLKHKRKFSCLTPRELKIVSKKSNLSICYHLFIKKPYLFITRKILGWEERIGPEERNF